MRVNYLDYSLNPKIRVENFQNDQDIFFFQKFLFFKNEREYRFFTNHLEKEVVLVNLKETFGYSETIKNVENLIDDLLIEILTFTKNQ